MACGTELLALAAITFVSRKHGFYSWLKTPLSYPDQGAPTTAVSFESSAILIFNQYAVFAAIAIPAGVYCCWLGYRLLERKRRLLSIPCLPVIEAQQGAVEISGVARGPYTIPAPITGLPCFLYRVIAWEWLDIRNKWEQVAEETLHLPFFIDDATGQLLIEPLGAELELPADFREEYGSPKLALRFHVDSADLPPRVGSFLARHGVARGYRFRVEETTIRPDASLFAVGSVTENPGVELRAATRSNGSYGTESLANCVRTTGASKTIIPGSYAPAARDPEIIRLEGGSAPLSSQEMTQQAKIAAALSRAGITKSEAWLAAGVPQASALEVDERVSALHLESAHARDVISKSTEFEDEGREHRRPEIVMMKGADETPFLLSFRSQKEVVSAVGLNAVAMICGGAALSILGVVMVVYQP
jgi:hypothetical protein